MLIIKGIYLLFLYYTTKLATENIQMGLNSSKRDTKKGWFLQEKHTPIIYFFNDALRRTSSGYPLREPSYKARS